MFPSVLREEVLGCDVPVLVSLQYPVPDSTLLKNSKIGKAIMLLYKHPKEVKKNKLKAGRVISECILSGLDTLAG
jgi:hypothetical protein